MGKVEGINFAKFYENTAFLTQLKTKKIVFLGDIPNANNLDSMKVAIQNEIITPNFQTDNYMSGQVDKQVQLHVILEHFNIDMQFLLKKYQLGNIGM